jgi:hypothetical protein
MSSDPVREALKAAERALHDLSKDSASEAAVLAFLKTLRDGLQREYDAIKAGGDNYELGWRESRVHELADIISSIESGER